MQWYTCTCISGILKPDPTLGVNNALELTTPVDGRTMSDVTVGSEKIGVVPSFYYRGDSLSSGGGCELAFITKCCVMSHGVTSMIYSICLSGLYFSWNELLYIHSFFKWKNLKPWWCHQIETFSALIAFCGGNSFTKASDAEVWCFLWSAPEQTVENTIETPMIWDATTLIMTSL